MHRSVIVLCQNPDQGTLMFRQIKKRGLVLNQQISVPALEFVLESEKPLAVIIDIDSNPLDNKSLQLLHKKSPKTSFLLLSEKKCHPDLKESIGRYVYACISKPIDPDELNFWLKCIQDDGSWTKTRV